MKIGAHTVNARRMTADDLCVVGGLMQAVQKTIGPSLDAGPDIGIEEFVKIWPGILDAAESLMSNPDQKIDLGALPLDEAVNAISEFAVEWMQVNASYTAENVAPAVTEAAKGVIELSNGIKAAVSR